MPHGDELIYSVITPSFVHWSIEVVEHSGGKLKYLDRIKIKLFLFK